MCKARKSHHGHPILQTVCITCQWHIIFETKSQLSALIPSLAHPSPSVWSSCLRSYQAVRPTILIQHTGVLPVSPLMKDCFLSPAQVLRAVHPEVIQRIWQDFKTQELTNLEQSVSNASPTLILLYLSKPPLKLVCSKLSKVRVFHSHLSLFHCP